MSAAPPLPPRPVPDQDTLPFWDGVAERMLIVPRCASCGQWIWQPRPVCYRCRATNPVWTQVSGNGRVASWTVLHPPVLPVWADRLPLVVLLVELDEGIRMVGQLVDDEGTLLQTDGTAEGLAMGARVALRWRKEADITLPAWTLVGD
ncbi:MAG: Zn-ribbon domain-containing OB-fold protein [Actinomycetota bacterium]|nr:OB-fold domain-containing protein [Actinomycetota bacterium]